MHLNSANVNRFFQGYTKSRIIGTFSINLNVLAVFLTFSEFLLAVFRILDHFLLAVFRIEARKHSIFSIQTLISQN